MDDVLSNKAASIERCLKRIEEEYLGSEALLETDITRQDAIILNLQRACEVSIDAAMHLVRKHQAGIPRQSREAFVLLAEAKIIDESLSIKLQAMVGFRNIAVHEYTKLNLDILRAILDGRLSDFRAFVAVLLAQ